MRINSKVVSDIETGRILQRVAKEYTGPLAKMLGVSRMLSSWSTAVLGSPATSAETAIVTLPGFTPPSDTDVVLLFGWLAFTVGTSGVSTRARIEQGAAAGGTAVGDTGLVSATAAKLVTLVVFATDTPGVVNNFQYTMTLIVGSGAAISTVSQAALFAICL
jgi:hypothetical protein